MSDRARIAAGVAFGLAAGLAGGLPSGSWLAALLMASGLGLLGFVIATLLNRQRAEHGDRSS